MWHLQITFIKNKDSPLFLIKLFKKYLKWQWGKIGTATQLFTLKLGSDQKCINSCKKGIKLLMFGVKTHPEQFYSTLEAYATHCFTSSLF